MFDCEQRDMLIPRLGWYAINILQVDVLFGRDLNMPGSAAMRVIPSLGLGRWILG
jgi:hypothetical protein